MSALDAPDALDAAGLDRLLEESVPRPSGRWYGVHPATVTDIRDPDGLGRVKITLPWAPDTDGARYEAWARLATLMAGKDRGTWFVPDPGDEVLVSFQGGDPRWPYVLGGLWNGADPPPETMDAAGANERRVIRSRNGVRIALDDTDGTESLTVETPGGQRIVLRDGPGEVEVRDSNGNSIRFTAEGVTVTAAARVVVNAATAEISAASLTVKAGMSTFSGVVKADTVIANAVVSASYTPGAGNIW